MSVKIPDYVLTEDCKYVAANADTITIPQGSYVKPIEYKYVPTHVKDDYRWRYFRETEHIFCYTKYGMVMVRRDHVRVR